MANWKIRYHPEAADEIEEADAWFRSRDENAAARWRAAARDMIELIAKRPKLRAADLTGIREARVGRFRYKIVYRLISDFVEIVAVAHTSRRPGYWRSRLD
jgi:toxin ParE1/3/4